MKKRITKLLAAALILTLCAAALPGCGQTKQESTASNTDKTAKTTFHIASLKGPTTIGLVKLMSDQEAGTANNDYQVNMYGTPDEIVPKIVSGDIDVALVPCNLASVLYNKTEGAVQVAAVNTLGVLYIVESGDTVKSIADLKGKTIYSTGKGTTPEYALDYILKKNGIDPAKDLTIEYKSESTEVAVELAKGENVIGVLPQPYVAAVQAQNSKVRVALSLTDEWNKVSTDSSMITGVLIVRKDFAEKNPKAFEQFLNDYKASTEYTNANVAKTAELVAKYGIVEKAAIAEKAIPACNITYIDGPEMKTKISGYLSVLYDADPQSVGGALPKDGFYFQR